MPNCSFGAGTAWQSRCATSIKALARYIPFFFYFSQLLGCSFFFCGKKKVWEKGRQFFCVKRYYNMYIYINRTRPHNGTKKEGWKGAIRRNDEYKTNRQRGQQNWVEQKGTKIVQGGRLNKPHTHTTRAKKKTGKYIFIYIRKKNGRWRRHAASSTGKEK